MGLIKKVILRLFNGEEKPRRSKQAKLFYKKKKKLKKKYPQGGYVAIFKKDIIGVWSDSITATNKAREKYPRGKILIASLDDY